MISFKDPKDQLPSALAIAGIALLLVSAVANFTVRSKSIATEKRKVNKELATLDERLDKANVDLSAAESTIKKNKWETKADSIQPAALDTLTKIAKEKRISIVSFRPQKVIEGASLRQLPFSLNVDGSFLNVADMIASIEKPGTKLAVSQVQFASKDGGETGDQISASITLVAYLDKPASKETAKSTSTPIRKPTTTTTKG